MGYQINHYLAPTIAMHLHSDLLTASVNAMMLLWFVMITTQYESFSDIGEIRVWFASKILTPCRMH